MEPVHVAASGEVRPEATPARDDHAAVEATEEVRPEAMPASVSRGELDAFLQGLLAETTAKLAEMPAAAKSPIKDPLRLAEEEARARQEASKARLAAIDFKLGRGGTESEWAIAVRQRKEAERQRRAEELERAAALAAPPPPPPPQVESPESAELRRLAAEEQRRAEAQMRCEANRREVEKNIFNADWDQQFAAHRERLRSDRQASQRPQPAAATIEPEAMPAAVPVAPEATPAVPSSEEDRFSHRGEAFRKAYELAEKQSKLRAELAPEEAERQMWDAMLAKNRCARKGGTRWGLLAA